MDFFNMMTSSNGNIFRVTGHLRGELIGRRWIPHTKASDAEIWCFSLICAWINGWVNNGESGDLRYHRGHYDVTLMKRFDYTVTASQCHWSLAVTIPLAQETIVNTLWRGDAITQRRTWSPFLFCRLYTEKPLPELRLTVHCQLDPENHIWIIFK